eukprot:355664-Chlamydomonas_euryale.AAC.7
MNGWIGLPVEHFNQLVAGQQSGSSVQAATGVHECWPMVACACVALQARIPAGLCWRVHASRCKHKSLQASTSCILSCKCLAACTRQAHACMHAMHTAMHGCIEILRRKELNVMHNRHVAATPSLPPMPPPHTTFHRSRHPTRPPAQLPLPRCYASVLYLRVSTWAVCSPESAGC